MTMDILVASDEYWTKIDVPITSDEYLTKMDVLMTSNEDGCTDDI